MKLGIHAYAWCVQWSDATLHLIDRAKMLGFDFIEIPLMNLETFDSKAVRQRLEETGLEAVTSTVLLEGYDITSHHPEVRDVGIRYLKQCVDATYRIGATVFSGVVYSQHVKPASARPTAEEWEYAAECLKEVANYARNYGVNIGIEPVNRYESYLINTSEQALKLKKMIDEPNMKIHLDTYHMNIEEKSFYEATVVAGDELCHLHLCENDRGIPGTGLVNWNDLFRALAKLDYRGYAALESFVDVTDNMNTWVWRRLAKDTDTLIHEGMRFVKNMIEQYNL